MNYPGQVITRDMVAKDPELKARLRKAWENHSVMQHTIPQTDTQDTSTLPAQKRL